MNLIFLPRTLFSIACICLGLFCIWGGIVRPQYSDLIPTGILIVFLSAIGAILWGRHLFKDEKAK